MASQLIHNPKEQNKHVSRMIKAIDLGFDNVAPKMPEDGQFGFKCTIATNEVILNNDNFDMEFDIPFDDDLEANEAEFVIYNLSYGTANKFKINNTVTVTAGYGDDTGVIFVGYISKVATKREGVDLITTINALDDIKYTPQMMSEKTYSSNTKASTILKDLLGKTGIDTASFSVERDYTFVDETKIEGSITDNIKQYSELCGVSTYISKQKLYSRSINKGDNLHFNINADTGMIGSPEPFEEERQHEQYIDRINGFEVQMILQQRITTGGIVNLDSYHYKGEFRIQGGTHEYDGLSATTTFRCIDKIVTTIDQSVVERDKEAAEKLKDEEEKDEEKE
jgi:hypothetical protein